jgi:hypothetical protein
VKRRKGERRDEKTGEEKGREWKGNNFIPECSKARRISSVQGIFHIPWSDKPRMMTTAANNR